MSEGDPTDESSTPPVVLCCATPDEATARTAADALLSRGHQVELVIGVEEGHAELEAAIQRCEAQGLYVLCRSGALPRSTIDELRAVLRAHEVPFGRTLTLAVEAKRPRALEERIVSVLRRMVTGRPDKGGSKRPTVSYSAPAPVSRPPAPGGIGDPPEHGVDAPSDPTGSVDSDEIDAWADSLVGPVPTDPSEKTAVEPGGAAKSDPRTFTAPAPDYQPALSTQVAVPEEPSADDAPIRDGNTVKQKVLELPRSEPPPVAPLPTPAPARPNPAAAASNANLGAPSSLSGGVLGPQPGVDDDDIDSAITVGGPLTRALGGPRGLMLVLGGVAALIVVFAIVVFATRDDGADKPGKPDKVATNTKKSDSADDSAKPKDADADGNADDGDAKQDDGETPADDGKAPAADDGGTPAAGDAGEPDDDGAADADDDGADAAAEDGAADADDPIAAAAPPREPPIGDHYEAPAEPPPPPDEPVAEGAGDAPDVVAALRSREVRALDLFVVAPEDSDSMSHASATAYCNAMRIAGLTGWRMPKLGELNSIVAAGMTGKGIYWSDTLGDAFGDTRIIVNAKRDRMGAASLGFEGARVLCIRDRR